MSTKSVKFVWKASLRTVYHINVIFTLIIKRGREDDQDREKHQQLAGAGAGSEKMGKTLAEPETHLAVNIIRLIIMSGLTTP